MYPLRRIDLLPVRTYRAFLTAVEGFHVDFFSGISSRLEEGFLSSAEGFSVCVNVFFLLGCCVLSVCGLCASVWLWAVRSVGVIFRGGCVSCVLVRVLLV